MAKIQLHKPILLMLYGFPGSGKTYFARRLSDSVQAAHINSDRIRSELFEKPRYDKAEDTVVDHLMEYMAEEFLAAGVSVVFDTNVIQRSRRRFLRDLARKAHAQHLLLWLQIDTETAFSRIMKRDKRKSDDRNARNFDRTGFDAYINTMQHPGSDEQYIVLSGKHSFQMQRGALVKKFFDLNLLNAEEASSNMVKPGMINLVPASRTDASRRNISVR